jgi:hypothetical protein
VLIDYDKLAQLTGFANYDDFRESHYNLVTKSVVTDNQWTRKQRGLPNFTVTESIHTCKEIFYIGYSTDLQHHRKCSSHP